jgi:hypothetical protein
MKNRIVLLVSLMIGTVFQSNGQWLSNGSNIYNTNSGNVLIGSSTQKGSFGDEKVLQVQGPNAVIGSWSTTSNHSFLMAFYPSYGYAGLFSTNPLIFHLAGAERMRINTNGFVGIGTNSPGATLDVNGNISLPSSSGNKQIYTWSPNDANWRIGMSATPGFTTSMATSHVEYVTYGSSAGQGFAVGVNGGQSSFEVTGSNHNAFFRGNVGIGTTAPDGFQVNAQLANETAQSTSNVRIGMLGSTPRIILDKAGSVPFEIDNAGGQLRIFNPGAVRFVVNSNGYVGIGTAAPDAALTVKGNIHTNEVKVDLLGAVAPDYVFEPTYDLKPLAEIETYIKENKHLPEVPSAKEMEKNGVQLGEMNMLLLRKIEELTLYILDQDKEIKEIKERSVSTDASGKKIEELTFHLIEMKKQNEELKNRVEKIENKK